MHIATRLSATQVAACSYPLVLKHYKFLKQEITNLHDAGITHKSMSQWPSPIVAIKKHTPKGYPQQDYRKLNSLLPTITPATGTKKGALALMLLPKIDKYFALLKKQNTLQLLT